MSNRVNAEDYDRFFHQEMKARKEKNGFFNLLVWYDDSFTGWTADGADANFKSLAMMGKFSRRAAYINADENKVFLMEITKPIVNSENRYFNKDQIEEALKWVKG